MVHGASLGAVAVLHVLLQRIVSKDVHVAPIREKSITQLNRTYQVYFCYRYYLIKKR